MDSKCDKKTKVKLNYRERGETRDIKATKFQKSIKICGEKMTKKVAKTTEKLQKRNRNLRNITFFRIYHLLKQQIRFSVLFFGATYSFDTGRT